MRQPGWDEPTEQTGSSDPWAPPPWQTGLAAPTAGPGEPLPPAGWRPVPPPPRRRLWPPTPAELRAAVLIVLCLAVVGLGVALVWWKVAPRLAFRVTAPGAAVPVAPEQEQFFATDGWFALLTLAVGVLAGLLAWRLKSLRGPVILVAVGLGGIAGAVVTWRFGLLLAPPPSAEELAQVGRIVHPALRLRATASLVVEPFAAIAGYLLLVGFYSRPDLGRPEDSPPVLPSPYPPYPPPY